MEKMQRDHKRDMCDEKRKIYQMTGKERKRKKKVSWNLNSLDKIV